MKQAPVYTLIMLLKGLRSQREGRGKYIHYFLRKNLKFFEVEFPDIMKEDFQALSAISALAIQDVS